MKVLYCHGFLSGPQSNKARQMQQMLAELCPEVEFIAPDLNRPPREVAALLDAICEQAGDELLGIMGSSLGGFWAARQQVGFGKKAVLINPCINPWDYIEAWAGWRDLYYEPRQVYVDVSFGEDFRALDRERPLVNVAGDKTIVILGQKDEVLDWRLAHEAFSHCEQWVIAQGDHGLEDFDNFARAACYYFVPWLQAP